MPKRLPFSLKNTFRFKKVTAKKMLPVLLAGVVITSCLGASFFYRPFFLNFLNNKIYDLILTRVHSPLTSNVPVIVDLDETSLAEYGQWPWPRYRVALLAAKLRQAGAMAVGTDILFAEADRSSPNIIKQEIKRDLKLDIGFTGIPEALMDNDQVLAGVLAQGGYSLGFFFNFSPGQQILAADTTPVYPLNLALLNADGASPHDFLVKATGLIAPLPPLVAAAKSTGFFNTLSDDDGIIRRSPLLISWQQRIYPSIAVASLNAALNSTNLTLKTTSNGIESLRIGKSIIPLDRNGQLLIHYRGPGWTFPYISAATVLNDQLPAGSLNGKIVLIGTSAAGLKDLRPSPLDPVMPGVEIQATLIDNILTGDFFSRPNWAPGLELTLTLLVGLVLTMLIALSGPTLTLPVSGTAFLLLWQSGIWFMSNKRIFISPLFPLLTIVAIFAILTLVKFLLEEREKSFFRTAFSKYVSKAVVDQISDAPEKLSLEGEEKVLSILFSDIRGFTSISEGLRPNQVIRLLNDYFTPMTRVITENSGTLDKFIGDAIMAFWNAPLDVRNHQGLAIKTALEMVRELGTLNKTFSERYGFEINIGIGLHAGKVRVGNIGTDELFDYTVIGDDVNLASRLEGLTKYYGVRILVSETMIGFGTEGFSFQELDLVRVKGRAKPLKIYGLYSGRKATEPAAELALYQEGLQLYHRRHFQEALASFQRLRSRHFDRRLYAIYEERCRAFLETPPAADWDGVFSHTSK